jgi:hypothetical protein
MYAFASKRLAMSTPVRHSLANTWISIACLLTFYWYVHLFKQTDSRQTPTHMLPFDPYLRVGMSEWCLLILDCFIIFSQLWHLPDELSHGLFGSRTASSLLRSSVNYVDEELAKVSFCMYRTSPIIRCIVVSQISMIPLQSWLDVMFPARTSQIKLSVWAQDYVLRPREWNHFFEFISRSCFQCIQLNLLL